MKEYHKINTIYKRDMGSPKKNLIIGEWATPEFEYLQDNLWEFTEKIDGTNIRVGWDGESVEFRGRTDRAVIPPHLLSSLETLFTPAVFKRTFTSDNAHICLYGEGYGRKIQKGSRYMPDKTSFILFDIRVGEWWLKREALVGIAESLGVPLVPLVLEGTLHDAVQLVKDGYVSTIAEDRTYIAEGVVGKPVCDLHDRGGRRIVAKIKHRDFQ